MDKKASKKLIRLQSDFIEDAIKIADEYNIDRNKILKFQQRLTELGVNATVRRTLGADIDASCGQLRRREQESDIT